MMIDKRLIGMMGDSKRYIAKNVALQWLALAANVAMIFAVSRYLGALYDQLTIGDTMAGAPNLPLTLGIVAAKASSSWRPTLARTCRSFSTPCWRLSPCLWCWPRSA